MREPEDPFLGRNMQWMQSVPAAGTSGRSGCRPARDIS
jgi:hypothetical protein